MSELLHYLIFLCGGVALDWAFYDRTMLSLQVLVKSQPKAGYFDQIFPRIILSMVGAMLIAYGTYGEVKLIPVLIGAAIFVASSIYSYYASYRS
jgi:hypothetical protein